jgi:T5SS/PEP-CTERM-associated repeat protein
MPPPYDGFKPAQTGLVDMGNISFYNTGATPTFNLAEVEPYGSSFSELVLNVTWAQLQPIANGALATSAIDSAIAQVEAYNAANGTDYGLKLRVWGGFTAPDWAKNIDGPAITVTGQQTVDPTVFTPQTIGRFWTADYIDAWTGLQNALAAQYDGNPVIRGISNTAGAAASDEPFVPLMTEAALHGGGTVNQVAELQGGGYNDAAEMLTLRASIADYAQWSTTPLDFTMNSFYLFNGGHEMSDANFALAVLQQARNSTRLVQAGNHALRDPLYAADLTLYGQLAADASLKASVPVNSFQTAAPITFFPNFAAWQAAIGAGVSLNAGDIELWDFPGTTGFTGLSPAQVQSLAALLAAGTPPPNAGPPDDGAALGFVAPASVSGTQGAIAFTDTDAVLLSAAGSGTYSVTVTSLQGGKLGVTDSSGTVVAGTVNGASLTLSGSLAAVNTVLAHLTDSPQGNSDVIRIAAADGNGNTVTRDVGVQVTTTTDGSAGPAPGLLVDDQSFAFTGGVARVVGQSSGGAYDMASALGNNGMLVVGGVQNTLSLAGNLVIDGSTALFAALSPSAYSTASLKIAGALDVQSGGTAYFSGTLGAAGVDNAGTIRGAGTLKLTAGTTIENDGTIEAVADVTLGAQQLIVTNNLTGNGKLVIDAGATLMLAGAVQTQAIAFAASTASQLSNAPYSPSTLELAHPDQLTGTTITGFTFADRLVLDNVTAVGTPTYAGGILSVTVSGGATLSFTLSGTLTGLAPYATVVGTQTTIGFAPLATMAPDVSAPMTLRGHAGTHVLVPDIVLDTPIPTSDDAGTATYTVTVTATSGKVSIGTGAPAASVSETGTLSQLEQELQTLAYEAPGSAAPDQIQVTVANSAGSNQKTISVDNTVVSGAFEWQPVGGSTDFTDPANWNVGTTPPGGANVALFAAGSHTATGNGAVGQIQDFGATTLTGTITAQGIGGLAVNVDNGGALALAGGALLTAEQEMTVGQTGQGFLLVMGGALALSGAATTTALVLGGQSSGSGTVVDLEQIAANGAVVVGAAGTGTLELLGVASSLNDGSADIGQAQGVHGNAIVNGGLWINAGPLVVGDAGIGTLLIDGMNNGITGQVTAFNATIGNQAGGQGTVTLDGGEMLVANVGATSSLLTVGGSGTGSLLLENGSEVAVGAAQASATTNNGELLVGGAGTGLVRIGSYSSLLVYGEAVIGNGAGTAQVTVGESAGDTALFGVDGTLGVNAHGHVTLSGSNATIHADAIAVAAGGTISGAGTLSGEVGGNHTVALATLSNDGSIAAEGGTLLVYGNVEGSGQLSIGDNATMTLQAHVGGNETLSFGANAEAILDDPHNFAGTIANFDTGDTLKLAGLQASNPVFANGVLTLDTAFGPLQLRFAGNYAPNGFTVSPDGLGGTNVSGGHGDVHMVSFDGLHYDFQAVGTFVAAESTHGQPWQVQIQTAGQQGVASVTTGLAASFGNNVVVFETGQPILLEANGGPATMLSPDGTQNVPGGMLSQISPNTYQLHWNSGETITVAYGPSSIDWSVTLGANDQAGSVKGLLGSHSGPGTDFQLPDGTVLAQPLTNEQIVGTFADAWRVSGHSYFDLHWIG